MRQKNLTISAFVLLLLVVSIGVLTIAGFRAQRFARLQMDFVASVSHELRTPLTAIFSAGENIRDGVVTEKSSLRAIWVDYSQPVSITHEPCRSDYAFRIDTQWQRPVQSAAARGLGNPAMCSQ